MKQVRRGARSSKESAQERKHRATKEAPTGGAAPNMPPRPGQLVRRRSRISKEELKKMASFAVSQKWAPMRKLTDAEIAKARAMFYEMDEDGSGSIDREEMGKMMRKLGQNPTDQELTELIRSVDEGDLDGKIQLREFFKLYAMGMDSDGEARESDVNDTFTYLGGDTRDGTSRVATDEVHQKLLDDFGLDVQINDVFGVDQKELGKVDLKDMLTKQ